MLIQLFLHQYSTGKCTYGVHYVSKENVRIDFYTNSVSFTDLYHIYRATDFKVNSFARLLVYYRVAQRIIPSYRVTVLIINTPICQNKRNAQLKFVFSG